MAHSLAMFARSVSDNILWLEDPPCWLDVGFCVMFLHLLINDIRLS